MISTRNAKNMIPRNNRNPRSWIPILYFVEGLPYVAVITIVAIMYKRPGLSDTEIALYTSWLYLPRTIKPLQSPFVDLVKTKRSQIIAMRGLTAAGFTGITFFIPTLHYVQLALAFFWLMAFSSATHDIAAGNLYMLGLNNRGQSFFVSIRNICYRFANIFGQGILVVLAGWLEASHGNVPMAWGITFYLMAGLFLGLTPYHHFILPHPASDVKGPGLASGRLLKDFFKTFVTSFEKENLGLMFFLLLTYWLGESRLAKIASPFLLDGTEQGGLGLSTAPVGVIYGTIDVAALLIGNIINGFLVSRDGSKKWIIPMALAINLPDLLYVWMAAATPNNLLLISTCVAIGQLGYGFGFTAYMFYLIYIADGEHKTAHYTIGTDFMTLGMMLPGVSTGWIQEHLGYTNFFIWVYVCTILDVLASWIIRSRLNSSFGRKK